MNSGRILVVDDDEGIRELLSDFLETEGYTVEKASDGFSALDTLSRDSSFDLVISDINMPGMKGFELLDKISQSYPDIRRVLITAYNINDYINLVKEHNIGNIITKTTPFNFNEVLKVVKSLIDKSFFELDEYLEAGTSVKKLAVKEASGISDIAEQITSEFKINERAAKFRLVIIELLTNAVFYGHRNERGDDKESWKRDFLIPEGDVIVSFGSDSEKYGVSIIDNGGRLKKKDILHWLDRQITKGKDGLPVGVFDSHGRGFFISREYIDRLIVNIETGIKTEIIILNYKDRMYTGYKPLYINES